ncbi:glycosyltransferase family 1 protein [candidate division WWE3 bacterium]|jgi:glycosyltransferase involved in cell wall biosynthesis|uniref:Glycosyltransferase family 1 protein n=1 Tax=candidate division WWE3 bacterium TaxID=2053526 RepID=A0A3A4ZGN6_UNCKA|nr:MAG: glycosyltransferase family 1 protein [candidate division WWE3 bacterium]
MPEQSIAKKIAFVSDAIWPYNKGGKEKRLYEISTRLAEKGYDVHIYCMNWWNGERDRTENGVHLHAISPLIPLYAGPRRSIKQGILFGLACFKMIKENWDVIEVDHMPYFPIFSMRIVCWLKRKKMYAVWHEVWGKEYWQEYLGNFKGQIAYILERLTVLLPDMIVANSNHTSKRLGNILGSKKEITTIPLGIEFDKVQSVEPDKETSDIIYVGRLLKHKNVDLLIKSVAEIVKSKPDIRCTIIGEGPEQESLEKLVEEMKLENNIFLKGRIESHDKVFALMKASKVFVSLSEREGFGVTVLEAQACGIPVVLTKHPLNASQDLLSSQNSYAVEINIYSLTSEILRLLKDKFSREACINEVRGNDWSEIVNNYIERVTC